MSHMWTIKEFETLPSTNTFARELLSREEIDDRTVIQALHQTAGRGRYQREWKDERGSALLMSIVLRSVPLQAAEVMQYFAARVVLSAVRALLLRKGSVLPAEDVRLKWPNDIYVGSRKLSGILVEAVWGGGNLESPRGDGVGLRGVIVGIGVNVNQSGFPDDIARRATSLKLATGEEHTLTELRDCILAAFDEGFAELLPNEYEIKARVLKQLRSETEWMRALPPFTVDRFPESPLENVRYAGIASDGAFIVQDDAGRDHYVRSASLNIPQEAIDKALG